MTYRIHESNKIDQQRCGGTMFLEVVDESDPGVAFCVIMDALRLARDARAAYGRRRVSLLCNIWAIGYDQYNAAFKSPQFTRLDFDPKRLFDPLRRHRRTFGPRLSEAPRWAN
jgi:hypothetical protein